MTVIHEIKLDYSSQLANNHVLSKRREALACRHELLSPIHSQTCSKGGVGARGLIMGPMNARQSHRPQSGLRD